MNEKTIIVWDLGATKCAASIVSVDINHQQYRCQKTLNIALKSVSSLAELVFKIEEAWSIKHRDADALCIAAAGLLTAKTLRLEKGYPYEMSFSALAEREAWPPFAIIHDYAPIVCASFVPSLACEEVHRGIEEPWGRRVTCGVGTGLGVKDGMLLPSGDFFLGASEFGHSALARPINAPEAIKEIHAALIRSTILSFEDLLSGSGLLKLHKLLATNSALTAPEQLTEILNHPTGQETLKIFAFYLGFFIASVQLAFMPTGGLWLSGGIVRRYPQLLHVEEFFNGCWSLPAYSFERHAMPIRRFLSNDAVFVGGAYYACKRIIMV